MYAFTFFTAVRWHSGAAGRRVKLAKNTDAKLLAGGHTLLPTMKLRLAGLPQLIDMSLIEGLAGIEEGTRAITISAAR